ncbi:MAG: zinc ribbon domain-containing protein, partial [Ruminiclostridium sp.]|nr:zinc ribbon domain-containing protein [Ruminiclostridium sp.]
MFCSNCGRENNDVSKICSGCGAVLQGNQNPSDTTEAAETPAPAPVVTDTSAQAVVPAPKKGVPAALIIIAASVLVIGIIIAVCMNFFAADIAHGVMGDEKYAVSVLNKSIIGVGKASSSLDSGAPVIDIEEINEYKEEIEREYGYDAAAFAPLTYVVANSKLLAESYANGTFKDGMDTSGKLNLNLSDDFYDLFDEAGIKSDEILEIAEFINTVSFDSYYSIDEKSISFNQSLTGEKGKLAGITLIYNEDGDTYITFDELSQKAIYVELPDYSDVELEFNKEAGKDVTELA